MKKCNRYPHCDCYQTWVEPAEKFVSKDDAESFALIMQEIKDFITGHRLDKRIDLIFFKPYLIEQSEVLRPALYPLFIESSVKIFKEFDYHFKQKSDIKRIEMYLQKQLNVGTIFNIFAKPEYDNLCSQLLKDLGFIDQNDNIKQQLIAAEILGFAVALKESKHNLLNGNYSDDQLMEFLQKKLKTPFTPSIKRRGKGYNLKKTEAKKTINYYMDLPRAN